MYLGPAQRWHSRSSWWQCIFTPPACPKPIHACHSCVPLRRADGPASWRPCRARSLAPIFVLLIVAGLFGAQTPLRNIIVVSVWIVGWVAISLCSALVGDVWQILNPWNTLFAAVEWIHARLRPDRSLAFSWLYPSSLETWPALLLFGAFAWMELIWSGRDVPARLAGAMLLYSAVTWTGMFVFGRATWCRHAEMFTIVFGVFARFAPLGTDTNSGNGMILRLPASGLLEDRRTSWAMMLLVIALLATVTFDGMLETPLWANVDIATINAPVTRYCGRFSDSARLRRCASHAPLGSYCSYYCSSRHI